MIWLEKICKKHNHYSINEIKPGHIVQLMINKTLKKWSYSIHIKVLRKDPTWSGKLIGKSISDEKWKEYLFHTNLIYRNYTIDPIKSSEYMSGKPVEFVRKPLTLSKK